MDRTVPGSERELHLSDVRCQVSGKIRLPTRHAAKQFGLAARRRTGQRMSVYRCQHCNSWHITKKNGYKPRKKTTTCTHS